jgi:transposase
LRAEVEGGGVMDEEVRLREPDRQQIVLQPLDYDQLIEAGHPARAIWRVLSKMDLSRFCAPIKARENSPGRAATDPRLLLALWLYGLSEGVNSARELERLSTEHAAYRWLCGGVSVNYHLLSDFRSGQRAALEELFTEVVAALMHQHLIRLHRVAQDGTRVRASAGAASYRSTRRLKACVRAARAHLTRLNAQAQEDPTECSARQRAAELRAAREYEERCRQALAQATALGAHKAEARNHPQRNTETRISTTDPEARVMKMADGGFRPAYNVQFATDTESRIIVGVGASNAGTDSQQLEPMLDDIERRTGATPKQRLADGGYMNFAAVERAAARGVEVFVPPRANRTYHIDPLIPQPGDSPAIAEYRKRMGSVAGKRIYLERAATAETVNADLKTWRGLDRLLVRGTTKVLMAATWSALAYNLMRAIKMHWL